MENKEKAENKELYLVDFGDTKWYLLAEDGERLMSKISNLVRNERLDTIQEGNNPAAILSRKWNL